MHYELRKKCQHKSEKKSPQACSALLGVPYPEMTRKTFGFLDGGSSLQMWRGRL